MSNILHIVHKSFVLPFFIGEQFIHFRQKGHKLHVICSPSDHLKAYALKMQFNYYGVEIQRDSASFKDIAALISICKYIHRNNIDIVIGHTPKGALLALLASRIMNVPKRIYFRHGMVYETMSGIKKWLIINLDRLTASCATHVVCVSPSIFKRSLEYRLNNEQKQIILNKGTCSGIDTLNKFNPEKIEEERVIKILNNLQITDNSYVIGYCGRLVRDKGISELIDAFNLIEKKYSKLNFTLLLVGGFEVRDALPIKVINEIIKRSNIIYTGWQYEGIEYYYALMDVFVLPSYREGFGLSIIEASSMEVPVIATKVTGCVDAIIENVTGQFTDTNSSKIADAISFYIKNPEIGKVHGKNGREFVVNNFDQQIVWNEIEKLYI